MEVSQEMYCKKIFQACTEYNKTRFWNYKGLTGEEVISENLKLLQKLGKKYKVDFRHIARVVEHESEQRGYGTPLDPEIPIKDEF